MLVRCTIYGYALNVLVSFNSCCTVAPEDDMSVLFEKGPSIHLSLFSWEQQLCSCGPLVDCSGKGLIEGAMAGWEGHRSGGLETERGGVEG